MKPSPLQRLAALDGRLLRLAVPALLVLVALECWLLVLRGPVAQWRALRATAIQLEAAAEPLKASDVQAQRDALARLTAGLGTPAAALPSPEDTVVALIGTLGAAASGHGVSLGAVAPGARRPLDGVVQLDFDLRARGRYAALADWLAQATPALAPLAVTGLAVQSPDANGLLEMSVRLSAFQALPAASGVAP